MTVEQLIAAARALHFTEWRDGKKPRMPQHPGGDQIIYQVPDDTSKPLKFHSIVAIADDGNGGLPDWFFDGQFLNIEHYASGDVEWVPPCGPAPCWEDTFHASDTYESLAARLSAWLEAEAGF